MAAKIPSQFGALDDAAFADGNALDAGMLDAIYQAANRLIAAPAQMFSFSIPLREQPTYGEVQDYRAFENTVGTQWTVIIPPFQVAKKPDATFGSFRTSQTLAAGSIDIQINTLATPFDERTNARDNLVTITSTSQSTSSFSGIPLIQGPNEIIEIWGRARTNGNAGTVQYTGGSLTTAEIIGMTRDAIVCQGAGGTGLLWNQSGVDGVETFASAGYSVAIFSPDGTLYGSYQILTVLSRNAQNGGGSTYTPRILTLAGANFDEYLIRRVSNARAGALWTVEIVTGTRFVLEAFAGATEEVSQ